MPNFCSTADSDRKVELLVFCQMDLDRTMKNSENKGAHFSLQLRGFPPERQHKDKNFQQTLRNAFLYGNIPLQSITSITTIQIIFHNPKTACELMKGVHHHHY